MNTRLPRQIMTRAFIPTVFMLSLTVSQPGNGDSLLEKMLEACPYTSFCTVGSRVPFDPDNHTETQPCCWQCHCDQDCHFYGDCCPDVQVPPRDFMDIYADIDYQIGGLVMVKLECIFPVVQNSYQASVESDKIEQLRDNGPAYFMEYTSTCPDHYRYGSYVGFMTGLMCLETGMHDSTIEDVVPVSDDLTGDLYRNKHCALCNGIRNITQWNIRVHDCATPLEDLRLTLSELKSYIRWNCLVTFVRLSLAANDRFELCEPRLQRNVLMNCPDGTDKEIAAACENATTPRYSDRSLISPYVYKNIFCYYCHHGEIDSATGKYKHKDLCPLREHDPTVTVPMPFEFSIITKSMSNFEEQLVRAADGKCRESQILDRRVDQCRDLFCPPFHILFNGKCEAILNPTYDLHFHLEIVFMASETITIQEKVVPYNDSIANEVLQKFEKRFKPCTLGNFLASLHFSESRNELSYIHVQMTLGLNTDCRIQDIGNKARTNSRITEHWLVDGNKTVVMDGRTTFMDMTRMPLGVKDDRTGAPPVRSSLTPSAIMVSIQPKIRPVAIVRKFYICPCVLLSLGEYGKLGQGSGNVPNEEMDAVTLIQLQTDGSYFLSKNEIAVCVDDFLNMPIHNATGKVLYFGSRYVVFLMYLSAKLIANFLAKT